MRIFLLIILTPLACSCGWFGSNPVTPQDGSEDEVEDGLLDQDADSADMDVGDEAGPCPEGFTLCGDDCVDLQSDPGNCGECGNACSEDRNCVSGECICREGLMVCGGDCVDIFSDPENCGGCGISCADGEVCNNGECAQECDPGLTNCSGACVDTTSDPMNCGECGNVCSNAVGADGFCDRSECILVCQENRWDLDGLPGCEYVCVFTSDDDICDGEDNDCDGSRDEIFDCIQGEIVACTTSCGTTGSGACTEDCRFPTGSACNPPDEICNGEDDDCDDVCDNGFDCCAGENGPCTTSCGSTGTQTCSESCTPGTCVPPDEICNGEDDDCDGDPDNGFDCPIGLGRICTTDCGTTGTQGCEEPTCTWGRCCADSETCGNDCDDDCNGIPEDGCTMPPPNDTCANPQYLSESGRYTGSTVAATDNASSGCGSGTGGKDVFFSFDLSTPADVFISTYGSDFNTVLYVGTTCGDDNMGCSNDHSFEVAQSHIQLHLGSGTYYIAIDGNSSADSGDYVLDVYATEMDEQGDRCGFPEEFAGSRESDNTCGFSSEYMGSCSHPAPPIPPDDVVYFFVIPNSSPPHTVEFSSCSRGTAYDSLLFIRQVCSERSSEVACNNDVSLSECSDTEQAVVSATLGPGVYYLFVDGWCDRPSCDYCGGYEILATGL